MSMHIPLRKEIADEEENAVLSVSAAAVSTNHVADAAATADTPQ